MSIRTTLIWLIKNELVSNLLMILERNIMDRSIAQALSGLVPTLNELPAELLDLAVSLLAQSRSHASSLKAEEEIARSYACANLACERYAYNSNQRTGT